MKIKDITEGLALEKASRKLCVSTTVGGKKIKGKKYGGPLPDYS